MKKKVICLCIASTMIVTSACGKNDVSIADTLKEKLDTITVADDEQPSITTDHGTTAYLLDDGYYYEGRTMIEALENQYGKEEIVDSNGNTLHLPSGVVTTPDGKTGYYLKDSSGENIVVNFIEGPINIETFTGNYSYYDSEGIMHGYSPTRYTADGIVAEFPTDEANIYEFIGDVEGQTNSLAKPAGLIEYFADDGEYFYYDYFEMPTHPRNSNVDASSIKKDFFSQSLYRLYTTLGEDYKPVNVFGENDFYNEFGLIVPMFEYIRGEYVGSITYSDFILEVKTKPGKTEEVVELLNNYVADQQYINNNDEKIAARKSAMKVIQLGNNIVILVGLYGNMDYNMTVEETKTKAMDTVDRAIKVITDTYNSQAANSSSEPAPEDYDE